MGSERRSSKPKVPGSSPGIGATIYAGIAQQVLEHLSCKQEVLSSNLSLGKFHARVAKSAKAPVLETGY